MQADGNLTIGLFAQRAAILAGDAHRCVARFKIFALGCLLRMIDLAQIKDSALGGVTGTQTAVFDDAPIAMHLAVFFVSVVA